MLTSNEKILERWTEFYQELYDDPNTCQPIPLQDFPFQVLKAGGDILIDIFCKFFNLIIETGEIPSNFKRAFVVISYKKDYRLECKNYRPISLLSHIYNFFASIIRGRISDDLYACTASSQAAYQPGRSTIEQLFCAKPNN